MYQLIKNIVVFAIPINFVWEMAQMPFYKNMPWNLDTVFYCLIASVGDAVMILIIFFTVAFTVKNISWIYKIRFKEILISLVIGFILSVFVEQTALSIYLWGYSNLMPKLPLLDVGISPVLQMLILPLFIFYLSQVKLLTISSKSNKL